MPNEITQNKGNKILVWLSSASVLGLTAVLALQIGLLYEAKLLCQRASLLMAQAVAEKGRLDTEEMQIAFAKGISPLYAHLSDEAVADTRLKNRAIQAAFEDARQNLKILVTAQKPQNTAFGTSLDGSTKTSLVRVETIYGYQPLPIFQDLTLKVWGYYFSEEGSDQVMLSEGRMPIRNTVTLNRIVKKPKDPPPTKKPTEESKISI